MARLGEICEILDNKRIPITASNRKSGPYPYYGANGVQDYVDSYIFDDELVLLAEDGGNFGSKEKPIAYRVSGKCWVNNHAHVLKPKEGLDVNYLCYSLMFYDVTGLVNGATRQKLTQADMKQMEIPLPPMEEQKKIAAVLDKVSDLIAKRRRQLDKLDLLVKARFVEMFGDPVDNSCMGQKVPLGTVADVGSSKRIFEKEYVRYGVPFYRTKEIVELSKGNKISTELFITKERFDEIRREYGVPKKGDLLISAVGTIGVIWIVDGKSDFYFKDGNLLRVSVANNLNPVYLKMLLEALIVANKHKMSAGTAYSALTISTLKAMMIYIAPIDEQNKFSTFVEQTEKTKTSISHSLEKLETLKKSLMQEYFG